MLTKISGGNSGIRLREETVNIERRKDKKIDTDKLENVISYLAHGKIFLISHCRRDSRRKILFFLACHKQKRERGLACMLFLKYSLSYIKSQTDLN